MYEVWVLSIPAYVVFFIHKEQAYNVVTTNYTYFRHAQILPGHLFNTTHSLYMCGPTYATLKGLSQAMDLAFHDIHG